MKFQDKMRYIYNREPITEEEFIQGGVVKIDEETYEIEHGDKRTVVMYDGHALAWDIIWLAKGEGASAYNRWTPGWHWIGQWDSLELGVALSLALETHKEG